jgi:hypothetical protein
MDQVMALFRELVQELAEAGNIERLEFLKQQVETDIARIGQESRLLEKYNIICEALKNFGQDS